MTAYEPTTIDDLIDDLCEGLGDVVILDHEQAIRFAWYVAATRWEWCEA